LIKLARLCWVVLAFIGLVGLGCEPTVSVNKPLPSAAEVGCDETVLYKGFRPVEIDITPLSEYIFPRDIEAKAHVNIFVTVLDAFGSQIKAPGVFRFELYEYVPRSAEQKGKRIVIWDDIDLTDAVENNKYWSDYLRAYKFYLDLDQPTNRTYILQVTCICPGGRRLSDNFVIKSGD